MAFGRRPKPPQQQTPVQPSFGWSFDTPEHAQPEQPTQPEQTAQFTQTGRPQPDFLHEQTPNHQSPWQTPFSSPAQPANRRPRGLVRWIPLGIAAALIIAVALIGASGQIGIALILLALVVGLTALVGLITGRRTWARIPSRKAALAVMGGALAVLIGGGSVVAATAPSSTTPVAISSSSPTPRVSKTAQTTPTTDPTTSIPTPQPSATTGDSAAAVAAATQADATLATLPVKGKAAATGYARTTDFGTAWLDVDHNGCDTRDDILSRDLTATTEEGACKVLTGTLVSPYTGATIHFVRGVTTSTLVQIDHVVPLENAWVTGAQQLSQTQREALANDPINLFAVDEHSNEQKSSGDAATWLPAQKSFRCTYVEHQITVKAKYSLWVTQAEHDAMTRVLSGCTGSASVTTSGSTPSAAASAAASPAPAPVVTPAPAPVATVAPVPVAPAPVAPAAPADVYYPNCAAVRAAGKAPLHVGDPGYSRKLDRDGDGIACE